MEDGLDMRLTNNNSSIMKTYLSIVCLIVLCGCQSYNRLSGGGFYTKSSQEPKEIEKIEAVSLQESEIEDVGTIHEESTILDKQDELENIEAKISTQNGKKSVTKDFEEIKKVNERTQKSEVIEKHSLPAFGLSILNVINFGFLLFFLITGQTTFLILGILGLVTVILSLSAIVLAFISLSKVRKDKDKYTRKTKPFVALALILSGLLLPLGVMTFILLFSL